MICLFDLLCDGSHLSRPVRRLSDPSRLTSRCPVKGLSSKSFEAPKPALSPEAAEIPCRETWTLLTLGAHRASVITNARKLLFKKRLRLLTEIFFCLPEIVG